MIVLRVLQVRVLGNTVTSYFVRNPDFCLLSTRYGSTKRSASDHQFDLIEQDVSRINSIATSKPNLCLGRSGHCLNLLFVGDLIFIGR